MTHRLGSDGLVLERDWRDGPCAPVHAELVLTNVVDRLFEEIAIAIGSRLYFLALTAALAIPDMCAGLQSADGLSSGKRYEEWFDQWMGPRGYAGWVSGEDCWGLRCSLMHQGVLRPHRGRYSRVMFVEPQPNGNVFHRVVMNDALDLDLPTFCADLIGSAQAWLSAVQGTQAYQTNLGRFLTRHPKGFPRT